MARFHGKVGYGVSVEKSPGVYEDQITEKSYFGTVLRDSRMLTPTDEVNDKISVQNSISILADAYANDNFLAMRYVEWAGVLWTVAAVEVARPRLILQLGEVYNGPTAESAGTP